MALWFKFPADMFDDPRFFEIEVQENGEIMELYWIKLLAFCARSMNEGKLLYKGKAPYTPETLAHALGCNTEIFCAAMNAFQEKKLVEEIEGVITIPDWKEYQDVEKMEREAKRKRESRQKARQRTAAASREVDKEGEATAEAAALQHIGEETYQEIVDLYNSICHDLPQSKKLSAARRSAIETLMNSGHTVDDFRALFTKTAETPFLCGKNDNGWTADLDWLLKPDKVKDVLGGKYDKWSGNSQSSDQPIPDYDNCERKDF